MSSRVEITIRHWYTATIGNSRTSRKPLGIDSGVRCPVATKSSYPVRLMALLGLSGFKYTSTHCVHSPVPLVMADCRLMMRACSSLCVHHGHPAVRGCSHELRRQSQVIYDACCPHQCQLVQTNQIRKSTSRLC